MLVEIHHRLLVLAKVYPFLPWIVHVKGEKFCSYVEIDQLQSWIIRSNLPLHLHAINAVEVQWFVGQSTAIVIE